MKISIESTGKIVTLANGSTPMPARIWEGQTENGVPIICCITRIAVGKDAKKETLRLFESELQEHRPPSAEAEAFPLRMIL